MIRKQDCFSQVHIKHCKNGGGIIELGRILRRTEYELKIIIHGKFCTRVNIHSVPVHLGEKGWRLMEGVLINKDDTNASMLQQKRF